MNIRKSLTVLMLSLFLIVPFSQPVQANPYDLFGEGNCAYFCWDMMDRFWPEMFPVQREWDAKDWVKLEQQKEGEYTADLIQLDDIKPGDFIIFPYSSNMPRGHVCFVLGVENNDIIVLESSNYAGNWEFPYILNQCRFRVYTYSLDMLKQYKVVGLTYNRA